MENIKNTFHGIDKHLLIDEVPSKYLEYCYNEKLLDQYPFSILKDLKDVDQSPKYHPEGSVWNHTMLVLDNAASLRFNSKDPRVFMWSALLHDIGKTTTTKIRKGRITAYNHDKAGENLAKDFLELFIDDKVFIDKVSKLVKWHMQPLFVKKNLPFKNIENMKRETSVKEVALLSLCDRLGRGEMSEEKIKEEKNTIESFKSHCQLINCKEK
ncbi:HD domain-containing protein [Clostridium oceanicum]|uniref:HD domain-containing protein n=1 Tax=Clostridium oceanicum TaxID=1543 RepID=A0ABP3ULV7_9CLOT